MRPQSFGQGEHLRRARHLEVEDRGDRRGDLIDVRILDVAAILAEMGGDAVGAGALAEWDGEGGDGLVAAPCLTHGRDVVDVDVEPLVRHVCGWHLRTRRITFAPLIEETTT